MQQVLSACCLHGIQTISFEFHDQTSSWMGSYQSSREVWSYTRVVTCRVPLSSLYPLRGQLALILAKFYFAISLGPKRWTKPMINTTFLKVRLELLRYKLMSIISLLQRISLGCEYLIHALDQVLCPYVLNDSHFKIPTKIVHNGQDVLPLRHGTK